MKLPPGHVAGLGVAKPKVTGGYGERLMRSMGWEAGQGLGKDGTGIKEAIQVKKKEDTVGVRRRRRLRRRPPARCALLDVAELASLAQPAVLVWTLA